MPPDETIATTRIDCYSCGMYSDLAEGDTPECAGCGSWLLCNNCGDAATHEDPHGEVSHGLCGDCAYEVLCPHCREGWLVSIRHPVCYDCANNTTTCDYCGIRDSTDSIHYCEAVDEYRCEDHWIEPEYDEDDEGDPADQEQFDHTIPASGDLSFTPRSFNPERGEMYTSVELEFARDPGLCATHLNERGLSPTSNIGGYHSGNRRNRGTAYVEYDGSVSNGGELIISKVGLPDEGETMRLWGSLDVLRRLVKDETNALDMRCGCHIHIDMIGRPLNEVMTAVAVTNYLEDVLYRIAASHYKRHRTLSGNSYAKLTPKSFDKGTFRRTFGDRYYGLNVGNYIEYRNECSCGAGFDNAHLCACDVTQFYKPTLEYRLWNATANPIKLHAYIAICQALVAYGVGRELTPSDLPPMPFTERSIGEYYEPEVYAERVGWMLRNLPFSAEERNSVRYCIRNSDMGAYFERMARHEHLSDELVQGLLHEDELMEIAPYIPLRREEAPNYVAEVARPEPVIRPEPAETLWPVSTVASTSDMNWETTPEPAPEYLRSVPAEHREPGIWVYYTHPNGESYWGTVDAHGRVHNAFSWAPPGERTHAYSRVARLGEPFGAPNTFRMHHPDRSGTFLVTHNPAPSYNEMVAELRGAFEEVLGAHPYEPGYAIDERTF